MPLIRLRKINKAKTKYNEFLFVLSELNSVELKTFFDSYFKLKEG